MDVQLRGYRVDESLLVSPLEMCMFMWFSLLLSVSQALEERSPAQHSDLTLSYISPQRSVVSPEEQVAWIIDASAEEARPRMAGTYQSHMLCDSPAPNCSPKDFRGHSFYRKDLGAM